MTRACMNTDNFRLLCSFDDVKFSVKSKV